LHRCSEPAVKIINTLNIRQLKQSGQNNLSVWKMKELSKEVENTPTVRSPYSGNPIHAFMHHIAIAS
jgi:hypothetical protein